MWLRLPAGGRDVEQSNAQPACQQTARLQPTAGAGTCRVPALSASWPLTRQSLLAAPQLPESGPGQHVLSGVPRVTPESHVLSDGPYAVTRERHVLSDIPYVTVESKAEDRTCRQHRRRRFPRRPEPPARRRHSDFPTGPDSRARACRSCPERQCPSSRCRRDPRRGSAARCRDRSPPRDAS